jgi:hypothetical protein
VNPSSLKRHHMYFDVLGGLLKSLTGDAPSPLTIRPSFAQAGAGSTMARNPTRRKKPPMSTTVAAQPQARKAAEDAFVDDLMKLSKRVLAKMSPTEREERLRKFSEYLASLGESAAKRA